MDNIVNDLPHENKFEIYLKNIIIIIQLPRHFFLPRQILKNVDIPWQKPWHLPTVEANSKCCEWSFDYDYAGNVYNFWS